MDQLYENITLKNAGDVIDERRGIIRESDIRKVTATATVESHSQVLLISEDVQRKLGLKVLGEKNIQMTNGMFKSCKFTDLVEVHGRNGHTFMPALVFSGVNKVLLVTTPPEGIVSVEKNEPRRRAPGYSHSFKKVVIG
jgi:hypothetical protein